MDLETLISKLEELKKEHGNHTVLVRGSVTEQFVNIGNIYLGKVIRCDSGIYHTISEEHKTQAIPFTVILLDD
jgi:hypothetical protein